MAKSMCRVPVSLSCSSDVTLTEQATYSVEILVTLPASFWTLIRVHQPFIHPDRVLKLNLDPVLYAMA
jgi:hypothetical protein